MRAPKIFVRLVIVVFALAFLLLVTLMLIPDAKPKPPPPLPFDASGYTATTTYEVFPSHLPARPTLRDRLSFAYVKLCGKFGPKEHDPTNWTFAASGVGVSGVQALLNQCAQASGVRYLMPPDLAAGTVQFGNSSALNGRQWIASVETALQTKTPDWWDSRAKKRDQENLVLIRYPEQKTVLVLPASEAERYRRTNSTGVTDPPNR